MQTTINDKGVLTKEIKVTFSKDEVNKKYNEKLKAIAPTVSLPGYRKGKVSPRVIEMKFKDNILDEVKQDLAKAGMEQISKEVNSYGDFDFTNMGEIKLNAEFTYQVSTSVFPDIQLPEYKGLKYKGEIPEVKEEEINATIRNYMSRMGELEDLNDDAICDENDIANFSHVINCDGKDIVTSLDSLCPANAINIREVTTEEPSKTVFIGKKKGDKFTLEATLSDTFGTVELRGKKVKVSIELIGIKRNVLPELNDEVAKKFGIDSAEKLKSLISQQLLMQKSQASDNVKKEKLLDQLASKINFEVPDQLLKATLSMMKKEREGHQHEDHVHDENCDHDHNEEEEHVHDENCDHDHGHSHTAHSHDSHEHVHGENCDHDHGHEHEQEEPIDENKTKEDLKRQILLEMIANKEAIQVTREDLDKFIQRLASGYGMNAADIAKSLSPQMANSMAKEIRWNKALELVSASAINEVEK